MFLGDEDSLSESYTFRTRQPPGEFVYSKIAIYGDVGTDQPAQDVM